MKNKYHEKLSHMSFPSNKRGIRGVFSFKKQNYYYSFTMKNIYITLTILFLFSCGKEKVLQLPEITHSEITDIKDVSHAYLFYDETQKDSVELNRKNLISTTNWLINVDKRLTLKQAIPHIKFLQEKKSNSSHKNKEAKNYFTCNDTSKKNLGFIEFTKTIYETDTTMNYINHIVPETSHLIMKLNKKQRISFGELLGKDFNSAVSFSFTEIIETPIHFNNLLKNQKYSDIIPFINQDVSFQDYITFKSMIEKLKTIQSKISKKEYLTN